jgi:hypothetical protein
MCNINRITGIGDQPIGQPWKPATIGHLAVFIVLQSQIHKLAIRAVESQVENLKETCPRPHPKTSRSFSNAILKSAKVELDHPHEHGDTFCIINKLYDNTILHKDYDPDS